MTKNQRLQALIRLYRETTGQTEWTMREVATFAVSRGYPIPQPADPLDILAKDFAIAAREEVDHDEQTGNPYRVNHALPPAPGSQAPLWININDPETTRPKMLNTLMNRREQMVGDGLQIAYDAQHWNNMHASEEPIQIPLDFTEDVEERMNAPD